MVNSKEKKDDEKVSVQIWSDLKDREVDMFAIKGKTVKDYVVMKDLHPEKLFLVPKATSLLSYLEDSFGSKYNFTQFEKYIVVEKK